MAAAEGGDAPIPGEEGEDYDCWRRRMATLREEEQEEKMVAVETRMGEGVAGATTGRVRTGRESRRW